MFIYLLLGLGRCFEAFTVTDGNSKNVVSICGDNEAQHCKKNYLYVFVFISLEKQ